MNLRKAALYTCLVSALIFMSSCERSLYTPAVFPSEQSDSKKEVRGPAFHSFSEAQAWALTQIRRDYPNAGYIIYRDLYWNKEYGVEMAKERLK
jgi:hypothetical protein